jgi:hypothetical protein
VQRQEARAPVHSDTRISETPARAVIATAEVAMAAIRVRCRRFVGVLVSGVLAGTAKPYQFLCVCACRISRPARHDRGARVFSNRTRRRLRADRALSLERCHRAVIFAPQIHRSD